MHSGPDIYKLIQFSNILPHQGWTSYNSLWGQTFAWPTNLLLFVNVWFRPSMKWMLEYATNYKLGPFEISVKPTCLFVLIYVVQIVHYSMHIVFDFFVQKQATLYLRVTTDK